MPPKNLTAKSAQKKLKSFARSEKKEILSRFFKTGPGQYGEGDIFIGVKVPEIRTIAREFKTLSFLEIQKLLRSKIHEERLMALVILVLNFEKSNESGKKKIFNFYFKNLKWVNNWDLVDLSAPQIVGRFLLKKDRTILYRLSRSKILWERRVGVLATFAFIRAGEFSDTLNISKALLKDQEDLMHKAVGWMLREVGKRNGSVLEGFLNKHLAQMPRTMLRYAIEKFPEKKRKTYLFGAKVAS